MPSMTDLSTAIQSRRALVVGSAGDRKVLESTIGPEECDLIEIRLDSLGTGDDVRAFAERHRSTHPLLITARHPDEGGENALSTEARREALEQLLPTASVLDLELRSISDLSSVWQAAADHNVLRLASWHDFEQCPSPEELREKILLLEKQLQDVNNSNTSNSGSVFNFGLGEAPPEKSGYLFKCQDRSIG